MTSCFYCGGPLENPDRAYRRVQGWERKATAESRRGGSDIVLRETRDEWACDRCVFRLQHGLSPVQETML